MKQKLLFSLLALLVSVGVVSGQVELKALDANQSITVQKTGGDAWTTGSIAGNATVTSASANSITFKVTNASSSVTIPLEGSTAVTSLTITGKVTEITSLTAASLTSLTISSNGELTSLPTLPATLTSLSCSGNKLAVIPKKTATMTSYTVGTQSPTVTNSLGTTPSNKPLLLTTTALGLDAIVTIDAGSKSNSFVAQSWTKLGTNGNYSSTSEPKTDAATALNTYYFMSGSLTSPGTYMDGDYKCDIKFNANTDYPNVIIAGVPVKVAPAEFVFGDIKVDPAAGGDITPDEITDPVAKGQVLTFAVTAKDGYVFDKYDVKNMTLVPESVQEGNTRRQYTVSGTGIPSITAIVKSSQNTITYTENQPNGTVKVYNGTTYVASGSTLPTGTEISIVATPNNGYAVATGGIKINSADPTETTTKDNVTTAKYTLASGQAYVINVSFTPSDGHKITVKYDGDGIATGSKVGETALTVSTGNQTTEITGIKTGTQPAITIVAAANYSVSSIVINNVAATVTNTKDKTYVVSGFTMPNEDVTIVINTVALAPIAFNVTDFPSGPITYTYDGTPKSLVYTTDPANLIGFTIEYSADGGTTYTTGAYTDVKYNGDDIAAYKVQVSRPADATFAAYSMGARDLTIKPADIILTPPTVTISKVAGSDNQYEYKVGTNGSAQYVRGTGKQTVPGTGKWEVIAVDAGSGVTVPNQAGLKDATPVAQPFTSATAPTTKLVVLRYTAMTNSTTQNKNFYLAGIVAQATGSGTLTDITVEVLTSQMPAGTSMTIMNGSQSLGTKGTVKKGTFITFDVKADGYEDLSIKQVDTTGEPISGAADVIDGVAATDANGTRMLFKLFYETAPAATDELYIDKATYTDEYDGSAKLFVIADNDNFVIKKKSDNAVVSDANTNWTMTYKNASGSTVVAPVNAGTYTVSFSRPADNTYKAATGTGTLIITKADPVVTFPTVAYLGQGQNLSSAIFAGGSANVPGSFVFVETGKPVDGTSYTVKFVPASSVSANYAELVNPNPLEKLPITYSTKRFVVIETPVNGTIVIRDNLGQLYNNGDEISSAATTLTITATPATGYALGSLTVNDSNFTSGNAFTIGTTSVTVKAVFTNASSYKVDITVPSGVQLVSKSGETVAAGKNFTFTLATAPGDVPTVRDEDGTTIVGEDGVYTLENVLKNKTITITLANPTEITVTVKQTPTENGVISVENLSALRADTYYYGDTLRLTATMKEDYRLLEWWDGSVENPRLFVVTKDIEISASFKYTVGIEPIEDLEVRGGEGYIYIGAPGEVKVTVVNMSGRSQQVRVMGEEYINNLPAGIYGVVVEQGNKASKLKVVVR